VTAERLRRLEAELRARDLDALGVAAPEQLPSAHLRYLSSFSGSSAFLVVGAAETAWILTDSRYTEQAVDYGASVGGYPGLGGVRLEDTLVVTERGADRLTDVPKHWQTI
jgi:Xaa-Pro aminopeptidase